MYGNMIRLVNPETIHLRYDLRNKLLQNGFCIFSFAFETDFNKHQLIDMKAHTASLINAILLVGLGAWGYFGSETPSNTALIPVVAGSILLALNRGVRMENKVIAHIAVLITLVIVFGLAMPLKGAISRDDTMAAVRVGIMLLSTIVAMVAFVKSFIDARKARENS